MKGQKNDRSKDITNELIKKASRLLKGEKLNKEQSEAYALHLNTAYLRKFKVTRVQNFR